MSVVPQPYMTLTFEDRHGVEFLFPETPVRVVPTSGVTLGESTVFYAQNSLRCMNKEKVCFFAGLHQMCSAV